MSKPSKCCWEAWNCPLRQTQKLQPHRDNEVLTYLCRLCCVGVSEGSFPEIFSHPLVQRMKFWVKSGPLRGLDRSSTWAWTTGIRLLMAAYSVRQRAQPCGSCGPDDWCTCWDHVVSAWLMLFNQSLTTPVGVGRQCFNVWFEFLGLCFLCLDKRKTREQQYSIRSLNLCFCLHNLTKATHMWNIILLVCWCFEFCWCF